MASAASRVKTDPPDASLPAAVPHEHYLRLLGGMAQALAAKGYADTSIADIVREAAVSRRTFYEHFETKADCLLALYAMASQQALAALQGAVDLSRPWQDQVETALTAYLDFLAQDPRLLKTLFVEILGCGLPGLQVRRQANAQIAAFVQSATVNADGRRLPADMAMAVVGGINELILQTIEADASAGLRHLVGPATRLVISVAGGPR
ncbi:TetR/AcrR family transcriptional regulator [Pigmentiphaga litoralis]|uniref:AcrR family transcriptional regulator n=1 Tax=Pigmentiphaga litoralis TaxID=516702 RepID=A0A7Y9IS66_9BURK|nr:TetR/AcrR family transcriptional regulator [Pigmentiphaga litoralis]NYE24536.1 AcrR family transcriptional regulator [Pigmentiphaga litoralis]NYE81850.1 AcrR family transcriptional regulator [Pigmentiphaga litoralis]